MTKYNVSTCWWADKGYVVQIHKPRIRTKFEWLPYWVDKVTGGGLLRFEWYLDWQERFYDYGPVIVELQVTKDQVVALNPDGWDWIND